MAIHYEKNCHNFELFDFHTNCQNYGNLPGCRTRLLLDIYVLIRCHTSVNVPLYASSSTGNNNPNAWVTYRVNWKISIIVLILLLRSNLDIYAWNLLKHSNSHSASKILNLPEICIINYSHFIKNLIVRTEKRICICQLVAIMFGAKQWNFESLDRHRKTASSES